MKNPADSSRPGANKNDREARLAEALRANLRRRKAFAGKTAPKADSGTGNSKTKTEKPDG